MGSQDLINKNKNRDVFYKTRGFCPVCRKLVSAEVFEKNKSMFIEKNCSKHGKSEAKIAKYAWFYKGLYGFYENLYGKNFYKKRKSTYFLSDINSECNLKCNICYAGTAVRGFEGCPKLKEISKIFFKRQLENIKNKGMAIRLLGGEPTLREDLPELIRLIKESGNVADLATNGIKIADDINYLKTLKENGLKSVYIWIDSLKNKNISNKIRGGNFINYKLKALRNLKKLQISTNIIQVIIKNLNEGEVGDVLELARINKFVSRIRIHGYKHMGKAYFSPNQEFLSDELTEVIARRLPEIFTIKKVYYFQKLVYALNATKGVPVCHLNYNFIVPRKDNLKVFDFDKLPGILDEFEKIWLKNKAAAENFLFRRLRLMMGKYFLILENNFRNKLFADNFLEVLIGCSATVFNFDEKSTNQQCLATSLNPGLERNISRCEENIRLHSVVGGNNINQCKAD